MDKKKITNITDVFGPALKSLQKGMAEMENGGGSSNAQLLSTFSFEPKDLLNFARSNLYQKAILSKTAVHERQISKRIPSDVEQFLSKVEKSLRQESDYNLAYAVTEFHKKRSYFYISERGAVNLDISESSGSSGSGVSWSGAGHTVTITMVSSSKELANGLQDMFENLIDGKDNK